LTYSDHYREADFFINWSDYSYNDPSSDSVGVKIIDIVPPHRRMTYKLNRENLRLGVAYEHKMIMPPTAQKNWDDRDISGMSKFFQCSKMPPSDIEKIIDQKKELFKREHDERKQKIRERLDNRKF